jgi:hypothetical protein
MSQPSVSPPPIHPASAPPLPMQHPTPTPSSPIGMTGEIANVVKRLDPNMLSVLLLTVALNGMFFHVYVEVARTRHVEFLAALNSCPARNPSPMPFPPTL